MNDRLNDFYNMPNREQYENLDLIALREVCATQEEKVYELMERLPTEDRLILESYLDLRNDLEVETINAAFRWGKRHYK